MIYFFDLLVDLRFRKWDIYDVPSYSNWFFDKSLIFVWIILHVEQFDSHSILQWMSSELFESRLKSSEKSNSKCISEISTYLPCLASQQELDWVFEKKMVSFWKSHLLYKRCSEMITFWQYMAHNWYLLEVDQVVLRHETLFFGLLCTTIVHPKISTYFRNNKLCASLNYWRLLWLNVKGGFWCRQDTPLQIVIILSNASLLQSYTC